MGGSTVYSSYPMHLQQYVDGNHHALPPRIRGELLSCQDAGIILSIFFFQVVAPYGMSFTLLLSKGLSLCLHSPNIAVCRSNAHSRESRKSMCNQ